MTATTGPKARAGVPAVDAVTRLLDTVGCFGDDLLPALLRLVPARQRPQVRLWTQGLAAGATLAAAGRTARRWPRAERSAALALLVSLQPRNGAAPLVRRAHDPERAPELALFQVRWQPGLPRGSHPDRGGAAAGGWASYLAVQPLGCRCGPRWWEALLGPTRVAVRQDSPWAPPGLPRLLPAASAAPGPLPADVAPVDGSAAQRLGPLVAEAVDSVRAVQRRGVRWVAWPAA